MPEKCEIALAKRAAPARIAEHATIIVLRENGYERVADGSNGFVCLVLRSWENPDFDACYLNDPTILESESMDRNAVERILPLQMYRAELGLRGTPAERMRQLVKAGFTSGHFCRIGAVAFSYMMSAAMVGTMPHVMVYLPDHYPNETLGGQAYTDRIVFVEGGPQCPYVAAMIYQPGNGLEPKTDF